jgi:hypothetical protein
LTSIGNQLTYPYLIKNARKLHCLSAVLSSSLKKESVFSVGIIKDEALTSISPSGLWYGLNKIPVHRVSGCFPEPFLCFSHISPLFHRHQPFVNFSEKQQLDWCIFFSRLVIEFQATVVFS